MSQAEVTAAYEAAFPILEFYWDFTGTTAPCVTAQFLFIDGSAAGDYLNLHEVVVKGADGTGFVISSGAMSSTYATPHTPCGASCDVAQCFNGVTSGEDLCVTTLSSNWWAYFDLGAPKCVATVELFNRATGAASYPGTRS